MVVYLLECVPTGKKYVGKTVQSSHARWREHRTEARIGRGATPSYVQWGGALNGK